MLAREGPQYGLALRDDLEDSTDMKIYGGKLYPNLDDLCEMGLVEKNELDKRTNEYAITTEGERLLQSVHTWLSDCLTDIQGDADSWAPTDDSTAPRQQEIVHEEATDD